MKAVGILGRSLLLTEGLWGAFKEEVTLKLILKDGRALQMQRREPGGQAGEAAGEQAWTLPRSSRITLVLQRALWRQATGSIGMWGWGTSFRKPYLSTPWAQRRKTGARISLALNVHGPLPQSGCRDVDAARVNSAGQDCS